MNALPFDLDCLLPKEFIDFGNLKIPKYGSLTPYEQNEIFKISDDLPIGLYKAHIARVLIVSRCDVGDVDLTFVPIHLIEPLYDFAINELNEWKKPEISSEEGEKKEPTGENSTSDSDSTILTPNSGTAPSTSSELP